MEQVICCFDFLVLSLLWNAKRSVLFFGDIGSISQVCCFYVFWIIGFLLVVCLTSNSVFLF